ncbi:MAG: hypothetical protein K2K63_08165 [Acetatifactor sp.]|nr:hypothetical protein [Acetatifactor sp.]
MQLTERLIRDTGMKMKRKNALPSEEEEDTMSYASRDRQKPLNRQAGVFQQQKLEGINTAGSVFDETAVFRTEKKEV